MTDIILASVGIMCILMFVSVLYYIKGKREGMEYVMQLLHDSDKKAFNRLHNKLTRETSNV
jgi:hypothetical protein